MIGPGCAHLLALGALALASALLPTGAEGHEEPLWDVGLGIGALGYEDYRGANSSHFFPIPVITFSYNGPVFKADKEGLHGDIFHRSWFEVNLSFDATLPVSNDATRSGMTRLSATVEAGLSGDFHLWKSADHTVKLDFKVPLRSAFTLQAPPEDIGWTLTPGFALKVSTPSMNAWQLGAYTGPLFANRRYNEYFYSVPPRNATATRPAYEAAAGYSGTQFVLDLSKHFPHYWIAGFVRYDTLEGAVFESSPLVKRNYYWSAGFIISWSVARSSHWVEVPD
jgi:outer membrane scaffolding protein for murein synthesis (MipA/OmpV family)